MAMIRITNLRLRTIIGINDWERDTLQDVIINISLEYNATKASKSDKIEDTIDYKKLTKSVIKAVEGSRFYLLEKLASKVIEIALKDPLTRSATVRVDKPLALRFADSVSVELHKKRK